MCNILYAQVETTKVGKVELFFQWCMVTGLYRPHLGDLIIKRLHRLIHLTSGGVIRCGGLITVIAPVVLE